MRNNCTRDGGMVLYTSSFDSNIIYCIIVHIYVQHFGHLFTNRDMCRATQSHDNNKTAERQALSTHFITVMVVFCSDI